MLENKDRLRECLRNVIDLAKLFEYDESVIISLLNEVDGLEDVVFLKAVRNDYAKVVEILLKYERVDPTAEDNYAIRYAAANGHAEIVEMLLKDKRVDPAADDNYAIRNAAANGYVRVVELLLKDKRVNPGADDNYAVRNAAANGHTEIVEMLLKDKRVNLTVAERIWLKILAKNIGKK